MQESKCPHCGEVFQVDETNYAAIEKKGVYKMKKFISIILFTVLMVWLFPNNTCIAEDLSHLSLDDLYILREKINIEIGQRLLETVSVNIVDTPTKIIDIFPDTAFATVIRDKTGKYSIDQTVTQEELDSIFYLQLTSSDAENIKDLTGIGYLHNLEELMLFNGMRYEGTSFPDELYTLENLKRIDISSDLEELSPLIGNLQNLKELIINYS